MTTLKQTSNDFLRKMIIATKVKINMITAKKANELKINTEDFFKKETEFWVESKKDHFLNKVCKIIERESKNGNICIHIYIDDLLPFFKRFQFYNKRTWNRNCIINTVYDLLYKELSSNGFKVSNDKFMSYAMYISW